MESYLLNITSRESGFLLQNKTFVPIDGPYLTIVNDLPARSISFVRATWNEDGSKVVACDSVGHLYVFDFSKNRFYLAHRFNICFSFIIFSSKKELLVALADCNIVLLNLDSKAIKNQFQYHSSCVISISFDKTGFKVLSASKDEAILWHLTTFSILRILSLKKSVDIVKVFFLFNKDIIVSAFKDNTVFLWDFETFNCTSQFLCSNGSSDLNIKAIDCSHDDKYIACAGKNNWFMVWDIFQDKRAYTVSLPDHVSVKQIHFLPSLDTNSENNHILSLLTSDWEICIYRLKTMELLHTIKNSDNKIISYSPSNYRYNIVTVCLQGNIDVFDVDPYIVPIDQPRVTPVPSSSVPYIEASTSKIIKKKSKKEFQVDNKSLKSLLKNNEEYPEKYRFFIWSQLLKLPHNKDSFKILYQESLLATPFTKSYSFMNPGVQKTFLRIMSMLGCWFPIIKEIDYIQCVVFPFIKVLHKNTIMCFELLVTLISNWCQNWFIFAPFPPFNILCIVENIIAYHDRELITHFVSKNISPEIYAWSLLQTSFSEVFNKKEWLKLWDNIFSNSLSFILYAAAAFNIVLRDVLFRCETSEQFKQCYQKHGISSSVVIKKAHELQNDTPSEIDPATVIGRFGSIPTGAYPSFMKLSKMEVHFETSTMKKILDEEIDYLKSNSAEIKGNYLSELQKLQILRRNLFLENMDLEDLEALDFLRKKLKNIQFLIQDNLKDQVSSLKVYLLQDLTPEKDIKTHFFEFKEYVKKLKKDK